MRLIVAIPNPKEMNNGKRRRDVRIRGQLLAHMKVPLNCIKGLRAALNVQLTLRQLLLSLPHAHPQGE